jgi:interferon gamma-inducible protein 30
MALRGSVLLKMLIFVLFLTALIYLTRKATDLKSSDVGGPTDGATDARQMISVDVYYEALCPDSRQFIVHQLNPSWDSLHEIMDLSLIPYGKASSKKTGDGSYEFECQHGPPECEANKFHACVVKQYHNKISVPVISCLMEHNRDTRGSLQKCTKNFPSVNPQEIVECADGEEGNKLLYLFGELTHDLSPAVYFIPTIEIEKGQSRFKNALKDLKKQVCEEYQQKFGSPFKNCQDP